MHFVSYLYITELIDAVLIFVLRALNFRHFNYGAVESTDDSKSSENQIVLSDLRPQSLKCAYAIKTAIKLIRI